MKIKEQLLKEIDALRPSDVMVVYDMMLSLKVKATEQGPVKQSKAYIKVREALSGYKDSMSKDILLAREDRV